MEGSKQEPKHVVAKSVHDLTVKKLTKREQWAKICYYYPQYTLQEASKLSLRDIKLLLKTADREIAEKYFNLVQIASAPHTEKGKGVGDLTEHYQKIMRK